MDPPDPDDQPEFTFPTSTAAPNFGPFSPPPGTAVASSSSIFRPPPPPGTAASPSSPDFGLPPISSSDFHLPSLSGAGASSSSSSYFGLPWPPGAGASSSYSDFGLPPPSGAGASPSFSDFGLPSPSDAGAPSSPVDLRLPSPSGAGAPSSPVDLRLYLPSGAGAGRRPRNRGRPRRDVTRGQTVPAGGSVAASSSTIRTRSSNRDDDGQGFTPHFINVNAGEDVYYRLMQFLAETRNDMCIISASGLIGSVTLRQPAEIFRGTFRIQGEFDIVALCGCYVQDGDGWTGGFAVSLGGRNGEMIGGRIEGALMAAGPVQVVVATFVCEGQRNVGLRIMELPAPAAYRGGYADRGGQIRRSRPRQQTLPEYTE